MLKLLVFFTFLLAVLADVHHCGMAPEGDSMTLGPYSNRREEYNTTESATLKGICTKFITFCSPDIAPPDELPEINTQKGTHLEGIFCFNRGFYRFGILNFHGNDQFGFKDCTQGFGALLDACHSGIGGTLYRAVYSYFI
ncbi:hypothetical protein FN846DRAFT_894269 [Sphaerosporella brunnea]|uniref:Uncharacterized protein n=1 Tax=Sphaerosporella brunnea TaxID=1250544 RepID=A0A5J5EKV3_9PEZI|nr:hypothetical protein FN846DRAFT_894269 [Sphaerosporella brunnea]